MAESKSITRSLLHIYPHFFEKHAFQKIETILRIFFRISIYRSGRYDWDNRTRQCFELRHRRRIIWEGIQFQEKSTNFDRLIRYYPDPAKHPPLIIQFNFDTNAFRISSNCREIPGLNHVLHFCGRNDLRPEDIIYAIQQVYRHFLIGR